MKKKIIITLLSALTISTLLTACNSKENNVNAQENAVTESETMTQEESSTELESTTQEESSTEIETATQEESSTEIETTTQEESSTETESTTQEESSTEIESNTEIDSSKTDSAESTKFTTTPLDTMMYATQQCNIRKGPSTDNDIIGALSRAEGIHITGRVDDLNWYEVSLADGSVGYISSKLLTETKPTVQVEASTPTTQQEASSQADRPLHANEVINPNTGEPLKPGDVLPNGLTHLGEIITDENGNQVAPNGAVFHRGGK